MFGQFGKAIKSLFSPPLTVNIAPEQAKYLFVDMGGTALYNTDLLTGLRDIKDPYTQIVICSDNTKDIVMSYFDDPAAKSCIDYIYGSNQTDGHPDGYGSSTLSKNQGDFWTAIKLAEPDGTFTQIKPAQIFLIDDLPGNVKALNDHIPNSDIGYNALTRRHLYTNGFAFSLYVDNANALAIDAARQFINTPNPPTP